jgi:hypothetical protein
VLLETLGENIRDGRFLRLIAGMLTAGYLEDWTWNATLSGAPQGGPASPVMSNIYLDRLDKFAETQLLPLHNRGERRAPNPAYHRVKRAERRARRIGDHGLARALRLRSRDLPSGDPCDPGYRRLRYIRYCDDILLGFSGPKAEAVEIKQALGTFLHEELRLDLSEAKTLITHAQTGKARFLGYDIMAQHANTKITRGQRAVNGSIGLLVPREAITRRCAQYMRKGKPECRPQMFGDDDYTIISQYQAEYRGVVQYYLLANDIHRLNRLSWVMGTSLLKTLAGKHKSTVSKMARKYKAMISTPEGSRTCFRTVVERGEGKKPLVAWFSGIPLKRQPKATLKDRAPVTATTKGNELIRRLVAGCCELCGAQQRLEVHHIRKLADLNRPGRREKPSWVQTMARRRRKTLVLCRRCHQNTHAGKSNTATLT